MWYILSLLFVFLLGGITTLGCLALYIWTQCGKLNLESDQERHETATTIRASFEEMKKRRLKRAEQEIGNGNVMYSILFSSNLLHSPYNNSPSIS
jgi:hypothetical protein